MDRRAFQLLAAGLAVSPWSRAVPPSAPWADLETSLGGRLGVCVIDTATGRRTGRREEERFPLCSTFKWLAAARVLQAVDAGRETLDRRLPVRAEDLLAYAPKARERVGGTMRIDELCEASIAWSDNTAANLLMAAHGGPAGVTAAARDFGDTVTRLDRTEPALNEAQPGDPRDTTSPAAMAGLLRTVLLGKGLSAASRVRLDGWMRATQTSGKRLRHGLPAGWALADKTGSGERGTSNDVGIYYPAGGRAPIVVAVYITGGGSTPEARDAAIARVGAEVVASA